MIEEDDVKSAASKPDEVDAKTDPKVVVVPILKRSDDDEAEKVVKAVVEDVVKAVEKAEEPDENDEEEPEEEDDEDDEAENEAPNLGGDVDQWVKVKHLDDIDANHRLRSLCKKGDLDTLKALLESNNPDVEIDALSEEGWTALHEIITHECQFTEVARILLGFGAAVNTQDMNGDTPLHSALLYHNADNILLLLEHGADLSIMNTVGRMPIHVADEADTLRLLVEKGNAKLDAQDRSGFTALHYAAAAKDKARVSLLLNAGANPSMQNMAGSTPMHLTVDSEIASLLLAAEAADPNLTDSHGNTALHVAVRGRHKEVVRQLLENKVDATIANANGKTAFNLAKDKEMRQILQGKCDRGSSTPSPTPSSTKMASTRCSRKQSKLEAVMATIAPKCLTPPILKKRKIEDAEDSTPVRKGPRLRFSDVNDYRGVEAVEGEVRRVRATPMYNEPQFSSDDDN